MATHRIVSYLRASYIFNQYFNHDSQPPNIWLGVTAENQEQYNKRILVLLTTPAAIRFVSIEPMLGPIELRPKLPYLNWVIVGGETGPKARPAQLEWVDDIRHNCSCADVPFFFKGWGKHIPAGQKNKYCLYGIEYKEFPE